MKRFEGERFYHNCVEQCAPVQAKTPRKWVQFKWAFSDLFRINGIIWWK